MAHLNNNPHINGLKLAGPTVVRDLEGHFLALLRFDVAFLPLGAMEELMPTSAHRVDETEATISEVRLDRPPVHHPRPMSSTAIAVLSCRRRCLAAKLRRMSDAL